MDARFLDYVRNDGNSDVRGGSQTRQVELLVRCENLVDLDVFSKTDPMCVLYGRQFGQWKELGRTEAVDNTLNPRFTETFLLDYDQETTYPLKFSVYDIDIKSSDLRKQDFVGSVETTLTTLAHPDTKVTQTLYTLRAPGDPKSRGQILITAEQVVPSRSKLILHLGATKLKKMGLLKMTKRSTCIEICRSVSEKYFHPIHRTEVYHTSQDPRWRPFELSIQKLCNGDPDRRLQFVCWHIEENTEQHFVGATITTLRELTKHKKVPEMPLHKYKKGDVSKTPIVKGHLRFLQARLDMSFTVRDYIRGGCSFRFMVAVDFTSSNGDPDSGSSLHHIGNTDNEYVEAIKSVGAMLSHYDLDHNCAAFGFGAKTKPNRPTKHCFPLNGLRNNPFCKGLQGVLDHYREAVGRLTFSGPSKLAPVIQEATRLASLKPLTQHDQQYWVLMVVTDGVVNDVDDMVEALIKSCGAPLSVVIVGIGPADFSTMEELLPPVCDLPLTCFRTGVSAHRSNVHFSALRKEKYTIGAHTTVAREALASVSRHMVDYFSVHSLAPNPPMMHRTDPTLGGWVGDDVIDGTLDPEVTSSSMRVTSGGTLKLLTSLPGGPMCPTCGSHIEGSCDPILNVQLDSR